MTLPRFVLDNLTPLPGSTTEEKNPSIVLHDYQNGNVHVQLFDDGTRIMEIPEEEELNPEYPLSLDVKITNFCDPVQEIRDGERVINKICSWCHEKSGPRGEHGDLDKLYDILKVLPKGTEIATGGGSVLTHPGLIPFLRKLKDIGLVVNVTHNQKHVKRDTPLLFSLLEEDLIKGLGISYSDPYYLDSFKPILEVSNNVVFHCILGLNELSDLNDLENLCSSMGRKTKVLLLGYKQFGFGINYYVKNQKIEANKYQWFTKLHAYFNNPNFVISFDNLGIEQMKLKRLFTDESWNTFFQAEDGVCSVFIDAVKQEFAKSSTSTDRVSFDRMDLKTFFHSLK